MANKNTSFFKLLTELPWWVAVMVAVIVYVGLTHVLPTVETGNPITDTVFKAFAHAGPFFAGIFLLASPFAFFNARRKRRLLDHQKDLDSVKALSWKEFEELVAEAYRRQGYRVVENDFGPDGGIDVTLTKGNETAIVQCKQWRSKSVGVSVVREMFGVLTAHSASKVLIICCGGFTRDATAFADGKPIQLIGGEELLTMVKDVQTNEPLKRETLATNIEIETTQPTCPKCGDKLMVRQAKRGSNAGNAFLGCSSFPKCRHTAEVTNI
jgi:restriction system protein